MNREALTHELVKKTLSRVSYAGHYREALHRDPSLSGVEEPTAAWIAERMPIEMERIAETGRIGRIGPIDTPSIAIRAELDALPVTEATGSSFASHNGAMHACGHDVHQAALLAVAQAAAACELPYGLVPFLQPREETYPSGALDIVEDGAFARFNVAAVIAAHVHPGIPVGSVATGKGPTNAAADEVRVTITGTGGHGAYPHEAANPIPVIAHIVVGLNEVLRRTVSPMHPVLLTVGHISGGDIANVIPETARFEATLRTMNRSDRPRVHGAIREYVSRQAHAYGLSAEVEITKGEPVLENDAAFVDFVDERLLGSGMRVSEPMRSCGADDFSFYSEQLPGVMAFVGVRTEAVDVQPSLHSANFMPDVDAVRRVALTLVSAYLGACDMLDAQAAKAGQTGKAGHAGYLAASRSTTPAGGTQ